MVYVGSLKDFFIELFIDKQLHNINWSQSFHKISTFYFNTQINVFVQYNFMNFYFWFVKYIEYKQEFV